MKKKPIRTIPAKTIEPYKYELHRNMNCEKLIENGFKHYGQDYRMIKDLFKDSIKLDVYVFMPERSCRIKIEYPDGAYYTPFYRKSERLNNKVYEEVVAEFHRIMDDLCENKIMWRKGYKPKIQRSKVETRKKHSSKLWREKCFG